MESGLFLFHSVIHVWMVCCRMNGLCVGSTYRYLILIWVYLFIVWPDPYLTQPNANLT